MKKNFLVLILLVGQHNSFALSFKTVSGKILDERRLIGNWVSGSSQINIYCSSAVDFKLRSFLSAWDSKSKKSCEGCVVHKLGSNSITVGPVIMEKLHVKWPYQEGEKWKFVVENETFTRNSYPGPCR